MQIKRYTERNLEYRASPSAGVGADARAAPTSCSTPTLSDHKQPSRQG